MIIFLDALPGRLRRYFGEFFQSKLLYLDNFMCEIVLTFLSSAMFLPSSLVAKLF
tara:strand:+ start:2133 stop:2297 length:165 start_codon:yes stop_codon:yes gene_type:complete